MKLKLMVRKILLFIGVVVILYSCDDKSLKTNEVKSITKSTSHDTKNDLDYKYTYTSVNSSLDFLYEKINNINENDTISTQYIENLFYKSPYSFEIMVIELLNDTALNYKLDEIVLLFYNKIYYRNLIDKKYTVNFEGSVSLNNTLIFLFRYRFYQMTGYSPMSFVLTKDVYLWTISQPKFLKNKDINKIVKKIEEVLNIRGITITPSRAEKLPTSSVRQSE